MKENENKDKDNNNGVPGPAAGGGGRKRVVLADTVDTLRGGRKGDLQQKSWGNMVGGDNSK